MGKGWVRAAWALGVASLALYAFGPLLQAPLSGSDYQTMVEAHALTRGDDLLQRLHSVHGTRGHPLAALSLALSDRFWVGAGWSTAAATFVRLENLLLLFAGAGLLGLFLRRLLAPWTGQAQAVSAGWACALLVALHPLQAPVIASPAARGDLLALALVAGAAVLFLRGRQEREPRLALVAGLLAILAGFSAGLALALPVLLAFAELTSARRYRPAHVRLRTAGTTLLAFGACVGLDVLVRSLSLRSFELGAEAPALAAAGGEGELARAWAVSVERLGVLLLPVNSAASGVVGFVLAAVLVLVVVQPAMLAARSAPRLWGWMLGSWLGALLLFELLQPSGRVGTEDLSRAAALFPAVATLSAGLAVAATSVSGARRAALPVVLALGFALLAHGHASAERDAGHATLELRADLEAARETYGLDAHLLLLDPPAIVRGVAAAEGALPWMLLPPFERALPPPSVRGVTLAGLLAYFREEEFERRSEDPLVLVLPVQLLGERGNEGGEAGLRRTALRVPLPQPTSGKRSWFREGRVSDLDLEGVTARVLRVRAAEGADTSKPPRVRWRATSALVPEGEHQGVWIATGEAPTALFDLSAALPWLMGERITQLWPVEGWSLIRSAEVREELPAPGDWLAPRVSGGDWLFDVPEERTEGQGEPTEEVPEEGSDEERAEELPAEPEPLEIAKSAAQESWALGLLDLASLEHVELVVLRQDGVLRVPGAETSAKRLLRGGGPLAWSLEQRLDGVAIARVRGRR